MPSFVQAPLMSSHSRLRLCGPLLALLLLTACRSAAPAPSPNLSSEAAQCGAPNRAVVDYQTTLARAPKDVVEMLKAFPKGGDVHHHLSGSVMPEDYIAMGIADGDCFGPAADDPTRLAIRAPSSPGTCSATDKPLSSASEQDRQKLKQSLSMDGFAYPTIQSGHDQFFATFGRFGAVSGSDSDRGKMLAKVLVQADADAVSYLETMASFQSSAVSGLATQLRQQYPDPASFAAAGNFPSMYAFLQANGLAKAVAAAATDITGYVKMAQTTLGCSASPRNPGCSVTFRFLSEVNRNAAFQQAPDYAKMFTQTAFSFLLASQDARVVGVNLVSGEDQAISMQSFPVQMQHFAFFHATFPSVSFALHGGELTPCFVGAGNPALLDHLTGSIKAGAKRLGHGISFAYLDENQQAQVAKLMRATDVLVELPFTSNAQILGVAGAEHPFSRYFRTFGVPSAFATDDEGVSYLDFTSEWVYAYFQYQLRYDEALKLTRASLQYSFLPGPALWQGSPGGAVVPACSGQKPVEAVPPGSPCDAFLRASAKATVQWDLESRIAHFHASFAKKTAWLAN